MSAKAPTQSAEKPKKKRAPAATLLANGLLQSASRACTVAKERTGAGETLPKEVAESAAELAACVTSWPPAVE